MLILLPLLPQAHYVKGHHEHSVRGWPGLSHQVAPEEVQFALHREKEMVSVKFSVTGLQLVALAAGGLFPSEEKLIGRVGGMAEGGQ